MSAALPGSSFTKKIAAVNENLTDFAKTGPSFKTPEGVYGEWLSMMRAGMALVEQTFNQTVPDFVQLTSTIQKMRDSISGISHQLNVDGGQLITDKDASATNEINAEKHHLQSALTAISGNLYNLANEIGRTRSRDTGGYFVG